MTRLRTSTLIVVAVMLSVLAALLIFFVPKTAAITNFNECVAAGYPIMPARTTDSVQSGGESYPEQCRTPDGRTFVNEGRTIDDTDNAPVRANGCVVAGCSAQLCVSDEETDDIFTTCEFKPEYACYREARCERQQSGRCGWTQTPGLLQCLQNPPDFDMSVN